MYQPTGTTQRVHLFADSFDPGTICFQPLPASDHFSSSITEDEATEMFSLTTSELAQLYRGGITRRTVRDA